MLSILGLGVFGFVFFGMLRANARRWRYLAHSYGAPTGRPLESRSMQSAVLLGLGGFNSVAGILRIDIHANGVAFSVMPVFSLFHRPFLVPFGDIDGWAASWYLDGASTELEFRRAPSVKVILPAEQAEWIRTFAGAQMRLNDGIPPDGITGRGWQAFAVVHAGLSLFMLAWVLLAYAQMQ